MTDRATVAVADAKRLLEQRRRLAGKLMMVKGQLPPVCEKYLADKDWRGFFDEASRLTEGFLREMDDWMRESCVVDWNDFRVANAGFLLNVELSKNHRPTTAHEAVWLIGRLIAHVYDLCKMANDEPQTFDEQLRVANVTRLRDELATLPNAMTYYDSLYAESARWQRWLKDETEKQPPKPVEPHGETLASGDDAGGGRGEADGNERKRQAIEAEFVFRPDGDGFYLKGFGESGHVTAKGAKGLRDLFRLVQTPGVPVRMKELDAGPGVERAEGDGRSIQPAVDALGLRKVAEEVKRLKADIDSIDPTSPDSNMERAELEKKLAELTAEATKVRGKNGKVRDLNASDLNRMKANIWGRINTVCNQIEPRFPKLSQHFRDTTGAVDGAFYDYTPGIPELKWDTNAKMVGRDPTK